VRALERWAREVGRSFPEAADPERPYLHTKIPTLSDLVEGPHARHGVRVRCAQAMIDACAALLAAKPAHRGAWRVTCLLSAQDLFSSELCIYTEEAYFRSHTGLDPGDSYATPLPAGRSLAREWRLTLPPGVGEFGCRWDAPDPDDERGVVEHWHYGEVGPRG
jgi:hypothetical protein